MTTAGNGSQEAQHESIESQGFLPGKSAVQVIVGPNTNVYSFSSYLKRYVPAVSSVSIDEDSMLGRTLVVPFEDSQPILKIRLPVRVDQSLSSLVDDVVWSLVKRRERERRVGRWNRGRNLLTQGYSIASEAQQTVLDGSHCSAASSLPKALVMTHLNSSVDYCKTSAVIQSIHVLLGDDILRFLLVNTSMFLPIGDSSSENDRSNYIQLTGPPLHTTKLNNAVANGFPMALNDGCMGTGKRAAKSRPTRKRKRRLPHTPSNRLPLHLMPSTVLSRRSLFQSSSFVPEVGLPQHHILNRANTLPAQVCEAWFADVSHLKVANDDVVLDICQGVLRKHTACDYHRLLIHSCPLPTNYKNRSLAELASSYTSQKDVILFVRRCLRHVFGVSFFGSELNAKHVLDHQLEAFIKLRRHESLANKTLLHGLKTTHFEWLVPSSCLADRPKGKCMSRVDHETVKLRILSLLRWLFCDYVLPLLRSIFYVTETEFSGKRVVYYRKPVWAVFRTRSMVKLKSNQFMELRSDEAIERLGQQTLGLSRLRLVPKATGVRPIATLCKNENVFHQQSGALCSPFRGTPSDEEVYNRDENLGADEEKATKKQKVVHLKTSAPPKANRAQVKPNQRFTMSTNALLNDIFAVLQFEHNRKPDSFGVGVHGLHYFYPRYREFIDRVKSTRTASSFPKLYFGSVDIRHCYDTINQERLLEVVDDLITDDCYFVQKYHVLHPFASLGRTFRGTKREVVLPEKFQPFHRTAMARANTHHRSIFVDGLTCATVKKEQIMMQLKEHMKSNMVVCSGRRGDRFLVQTAGIPQGSVLSSMLCNFYYGNVIDNKLQDNLRGSDRGRNVIARMVDDFIVVSTEVMDISTFINVMNKGDPALGVTINKEKTKVSVQVEMTSEDGNAEVESSVQNPSFFPWCGMLFDTRSGECRTDYSRFGDSSARDSLTVEQGRNEGYHLQMHMRLFVRPRCQPILYDSHINSARTQALNFHQLMAFAGIKTLEYIKSNENMLYTLEANTRFFLDCIQATGQYAYKYINHRLRQAKFNDKVSIPECDAEWLCWHAFGAIFRRHSSFEQLATSIENQLDSVEISTSVKQDAATSLSELDLESLMGNI